MNSHEMYMLRCLELAGNGLGQVAPNPLVGSVIVYDDTILGEGYHAAFGEAHAEVNAIGAVKDEELLTESTLYVNLEPCCHSGKTPPCTDLILEKKIPRVVIGTADPFPAVSGKGIEQLKKNGVEVVVNILPDVCMEFNRRFFTFHQKQRPYIILKWAQTLDGFIAGEESETEKQWITNEQSKRLVHKWRSEEQAIMVGTNTALHDNPQLTTRLYNGHHPLRIVADKSGRIPLTHHLFDKQAPTLVFTEKNHSSEDNLTYENIDFSNQPLEQIMKVLVRNNIQSLIVEGGRKLLEAYLAIGLWDEARIFIGNKTFTSGIPAPSMDLSSATTGRLGEDRLYILKNTAPS